MNTTLHSTLSKTSIKVMKYASLILAFGVAVAHAQVPEPLYMLPNHYPGGGLTQAPDGSLYGTSGDWIFTPDSLPYTIFKIAPSGTSTDVATFAQDGSQGTVPNAVTIAENGLLYGTTQGGGAGNAGVAFVVSNGTIRVLHNFETSDGAVPAGRLVEGIDGKLYGVTALGGAAGRGVIFSLGLTGNFSVVHSFAANEGEQPTGELVVGPNGSFYGTTLGGGANQIGTVFNLSLAGKLTTISSFGPDHGCPGTLTLGSDGNFYGGTGDSTYFNFVNPNYSCPAESGAGSLFSVTPAGVYTTLYSFTTNCDGGNNCPPFDPVDSLLEASDGNFYGVSEDGGNDDPICPSGTVFQFATTGQLQWYSFPAGGLGNPCCGMLQDTQGTLYGVTAGGNCLGFGTILSGGFTLNLGLPKPRPVSTIFYPSAGLIGTPVGIYGTNFIGATSVTFDNVAAQFRVISANYLVAVTPRTSTGAIAITSPGGTSVTKTKFVVIR